MNRMNPRFAFFVLVFALGWQTDVLAITSFGDMANNLFGPVHILTKLMTAGCYTLGMALALFTVLQIRAHRINPKVVPLSVPIIMAICSAILLFLPKATTMTGRSWAATEQVRRGEQQDFINHLPFIGIDDDDEFETDVEPQAAPKWPEENPNSTEAEPEAHPPSPTLQEKIADELAPQVFEDFHDSKVMIEHE